MAKDAPETPTFPIKYVLAAFRASPWLTQSVLIWDWSYQSRNDDDDQLIRAHGQIATDFDHRGEGWHEILAIVGSHNGDQITGLVPAGQSIPGNDRYEGDNRIRSIFNREGKAQFSKNGFNTSSRMEVMPTSFLDLFSTPILC